MSRLGIFLLFAIAACAHASVPFNEDEQDVVKVAFLRQNRLPRLDVMSKPLCKECEKVVSSLKKIVDNPETQQELEKTLSTVCATPLLSHYKGRCLNAVTNMVYLLHEMQWLMDNPTNLCEMIKFCKSEEPGVSTISKRLALSVASKIVQDIHQPLNAYKIDTCGLCTSALNELKRLLETPELLVKIQSGIEQLCKYTGKHQSQCNEIVEYFFPQLIQMAVNALCEPEQTCAAIKLCKRSSMNSFTSVPPRQHPHLDRLLSNMTSMQTMRGFNMGCMVCEAAVKEVIKTLDQPKTLKTISTDITNVVCKILPKTLQAGCYDFLNIYAVPSLQLTFSDIEPKKVCQDIHACTASFSQQIELLSTMEKSVAVCDACKVLSRVLSFELQEASFQQDISNVLTRACQLIPGDMAKKVRCETYIETYIPYILENTVSSLMPEMCPVLRLC